MYRPKKRFFILISVLFFVAVILVLLFFVIPINSYYKVKIIEIEKTQNIDLTKNIFKACFGNSGIDVACGKKVIKDYIIKNGTDSKNIDYIYKNLNDLLATHTTNEDNCHAVAHEIGFQVNNITKNVVQSLNYDPYKISSSFLCANGYVHGVMGNNIESIAAQKVIIKKMADLFQSPEFANRQFQYVSAMHEIGHYVLQNYLEINPSIDICKEISKTRENELSCITGIFMEHFDQNAQIGLVDAKNQIQSCKNYSGLPGYSCFFVSNDRPSDLIKNQKENLDFCNSFGNNINHYSCNRRMLMEPFGKRIPNARQVTTRFCMGQNSLNYQLSCLYLLSFDELRFYPDVPKKDLDNLLCSNFSLYNFVRCKARLQTNFNLSGNMFFALPENINLTVPSFWQGLNSLL